MATRHDHQQFIAYYQDNKDRLFTYLMYRLNRNQLLSQDLFMDIIMKAYEHFHRFDPRKSSFTTWIFTIARNHLANYFRDYAKKKTIPLDALNKEDVLAIAARAEDSVSPSIDREHVQHVLFLLKDHEREVIALRYLYQFSYDEIARVLGKNLGAVRTGLSRALRQFQSLYQKLYPQSS